MGLLDDLKHKVEDLGDKAREGLDGALGKAGDLVDDVKDRLGQGDDTAEQAPLGESDDVAADARTLNPTDVEEETDLDLDTVDAEGDADTVSSDDLDAEDASDDAGDAGAVTGDLGSDGEDDLGGTAVLDVDDEAAATDTTGTTGTPGAVPTDLDTDDQADDQADEPAVESDVDPYDDPLTEPIGDAVDAEALARVVEGGSDDADQR